MVFYSNVSCLKNHRGDVNGKKINNNKIKNLKKEKIREIFKYICEK